MQGQLRGIVRSTIACAGGYYSRSVPGLTRKLALLVLLLDYRRQWPYAQ
jgi:hypothetical protein